jgi:hypothetical protein
MRTAATSAAAQEDARTIDPLFFPILHDLNTYLLSSHIQS